MSQDTQLIQLDETLDKENKFILSSQVANIIGKEEQDFKISMSQIKIQDTPLNSRNTAYSPFPQQQHHNNNTINQNQNISQNQTNQTGNNISLMGQIHSYQHYSDFLSPKYYEIENEFNQNFNNQFDYQIGSLNSAAPLSQQQQFIQNGDNDQKQYDPNIVSLNNLIIPNNSQQFDQTYQNFLNSQSRVILANKFSENDANNQNHRHLENVEKNRVSASSASARTNSAQIINETEEHNGKKLSNELEQEVKSDSSKNQIQVTKGAFSILKMALVKNFANKLIKRVRNVMFKKLTRQQFGMIDDFASDFNYFIYQKQFIYSEKSTFIKKCIYFLEQLKITQYINQFLSGNFMLMPESTFKLIWDIFIIIAIVLMILIIPVCHIYDTYNVPLLRFFNSAFISIILVFELVINLNSGIFYNGITIKDRRLVIKKNLYFITKDIIVITLFFLSQTGENNSWINMLDYCIFWKIVDLPKKISEIEQRLHINESVLNWLKLLKLECLILIIAHIASCIFIRIALSEQQEGKENWLDHYQYENNSFSDKYLISLYFMIITMTTTGYGDIAPFTQYERIFILIIALVSQNVVGYSISTINDIVKTQSAKKKEFNQFMKEINKDMNNRNINIQLQHKIRKYVEYLYLENTKKSSFETNILEIVPSQLKEEVLLEINKEMISNINYLGISKFSSESQKQVTLQIKQKVYFPGEIIFKFGELNDKIYFINQGQVSLSIPILTKIDKCTSQPEMNFKFLKKQDVFGQQGFITNTQNAYTAKTSSVTVLSYISRDEFLQIIKNNSDDYEIFSEIKDKILFNHDYSLMKLKCYSCGEFNHQLENCPYVNFTLTYNPKKTTQEERVKFERKATKKNFHLNYEDLRKDVIDYLNQSVNSDLYSIVQQSVLHPDDLKAPYDVYNINNLEKQVKEHSPIIANTNKNDRQNNRSMSNKTIQNQFLDFENAVNFQLKENDLHINLPNSDQSILKHAQSAETLKNNYHNRLDIIKENEDENQIRNSMIPKKKEKQIIKDLHNSQENEQQLQLPVLNQGFSDINYGQQYQCEKLENILNQQNNLPKITSLEDGMATERQIKKHTNEILTNSNETGSGVAQFTNQKSKDSIQNSIDLQILMQQQQFLRNEEKKFLQNEVTNNNINSSINNSNSNSNEKNHPQGNSKSSKVETAPFQENSFYIEPLSGSLKKKASSQGLLFQRQTKQKQQSINLQTNQFLPLIQLRDESCNINTEWDQSNNTPNNLSIQEQLQMRRTNRSIQSLTIVEQEIQKRIEEKKQSCKINSKLNETFTTSLRNISRNSLKGLSQQQISIEHDVPQSAFILRQKQLLSGNQTPTQSSKFHRQDKKHATINLQEQQSTQSSNKHRDSLYYGRNNSNYTLKLAQQHLQPQQIQTNESKHSDKQLPKQNTQNSFTQRQSFQHLFSQGTSKHNPNNILGDVNRENKSKFIQFAIKENTIKNKLQSLKMIPDEPSPHEDQQEQQIEDEKQTQPPNFHHDQQLAEDFSQNVEFQIRCVKGVQDIDILVLRKIYLLAQLKNQRIEEIGDEWKEYIIVEDNEIEIDSIQNFKYYFPLGNFYQIRGHIRRKETKKQMKNRKTKKSQYYGGVVNTQQTKYRNKNTQLL